MTEEEPDSAMNKDQNKNGKKNAQEEKKGGI